MNVARGVIWPDATERFSSSTLRSSSATCTVSVCVAGRRPLSVTPVSVTACVAVVAKPSGTLTAAVDARVPASPIVLGVPASAGALGSAEPPCPEQDAVAMPAASAAATSLFMESDSSSLYSVRRASSNRHTENRVERPVRASGYHQETMVVSLAGEWDIYRR